MNPARCLLCGLLLAALAAPAPAFAASELDGWVRHLDGLVPAEAAGFKPAMVEQVRAAAEAVDEWAAYSAAQLDGTPARTLDIVRELLAAKARVDQLLDRALALRAQFGALDGKLQRDAIRSYLRVDSKLIDVSGRLRYLLSDVLNMVAAEATEPAERRQLLDLLAQYRSSIGALAVSGWLADAPAEAEKPRLLGRRLARQQAERSGSDNIQLSVLQLIASSGDASLVAAVAELLKQPQLAPELVLAAAETIRTLGLPQDVRPGSPAGLPAPAITASQLYTRLLQLDRSQLSSELAAQHAELLSWLDLRRRGGLTEDGYQLGSYKLQAGDWLLMRNPSPYNLFTDLSPGLFTHVGVVTSEQGADGIRRMVLVDLQEHGHMSAINVETFVQRSLHYVFLRHPDPAVARQMADAARSVIGNETEFDLNFRTERVLELAHQPLAGKKIRTYCAGLLLLCALQTAVDRSEFFPIIEYPAPGHTVENFKLLGMSLGKDFVSPTGALYSRKLLLVGRREPMYEPRREIEEAVYDYFGIGMDKKQLAPDPTLFNSLQFKIADAAQHSPLLAQALASASGINADADLVGAARAAAVLEMLDEVALRTSAEFDQARNAVRSEAGELATLPAAEREKMARLRERHADLVKEWEGGQLSPRELRIRLVDYYIAHGRAELDRLYFSGSSKREGEAPASNREGEAPAEPWWELNTW